MNINIIILICVYSCSSPARHRSRSGEAGGVVSLILFSLSYFWIEGFGKPTSL